jgi:hypothetical protein
MALSQILKPNDLELYCKSINQTSPIKEVWKNSTPVVIAPAGNFNYGPVNFISRQQTSYIKVSASIPCFLAGGSNDGFTVQATIFKNNAPMNGGLPIFRYNGGASTQGQHFTINIVDVDEFPTTDANAEYTVFIENDAITNLTLSPTNTRAFITAEEISGVIQGV